MRISDWSSDVCSSDLASFPEAVRTLAAATGMTVPEETTSPRQRAASRQRKEEVSRHQQALDQAQEHYLRQLKASSRSEEHTSELQSLMRNSYAVLCLKKNNQNHHHDTDRDHQKHQSTLPT